jgi:hypothetical protein
VYIKKHIVLFYGFAIFFLLVVVVFLDSIVFVIICIVSYLFGTKHQMMFFDGAKYVVFEYNNTNGFTTRPDLTRGRLCVGSTLSGRAWVKESIRSGAGSEN